MPRIVSDSSYVEILRMTLNPVRIEPVFGTQNTFRNFYFATSQYSSLSRKCNDSLTSLFSRNIRTSSTFNFNIQRYIIKKNYRRNLWDLEFSFIYYKKNWLLKKIRISWKSKRDQIPVKKHLVSGNKILNCIRVDIYQISPHTIFTYCTNKSQISSETRSKGQKLPSAPPLQQSRSKRFVFNFQFAAAKNCAALPPP